MRLKLISNNTPMERRFNPWIGGSILASLVSSEFFFSFFYVCDKKGEERLCRKAMIPYRLVVFNCYQNGKGKVVGASAYLFVYVFVCLSNSLSN